MDQKWLVPYIVSNAVGLALLLLAFWRPNVARWCLVALFAYAAIWNSYIGLTRPEEYQGFAPLAAFELYKSFIEGFFRENATALLCLIAAGQAVIAVTWAIGRKALWIGVWGTCIFLLAIAPLGIGSAFPFSVTVSAAAVVAYRKLRP